MWTPDVYEGAPTPVTAFMAAATKAAALVLTLRLLNTAFPEEARLWTIALAAIVCVSLAVGNIAALTQQSVKRLLAYSSVAQAGFMLIPVAAGNEQGGTALLFYLIPYGAASLGAFAVVAAREGARPAGDVETLGGMAERPAGRGDVVFMLNFAGLPLTGGFVASSMPLRRPTTAGDVARGRRHYRDRVSLHYSPRKSGLVHTAGRDARPFRWEGSLRELALSAAVVASALS
jgi:NADH-quinone oxidoreductase subunit N